MPRKSGQSYPDCVAFLVAIEDKYKNKRNRYKILSSDIKTSMLDSGLKGFISPLHIPEGEDTQYHFHVMIIRPSRQGFALKTWKYICGALGALNNYVLPLDLPHDYARYLIHKGEKYKNKRQYKAKDVIEISLNYDEYSNIIDAREMLLVDECEMLKVIIRYINDCYIIMYSELVDYSLAFRPEWFQIVKKNRSFLTDYMRSLEYSRFNKKYNSASSPEGD